MGTEIHLKQEGVEKFFSEIIQLSKAETQALGFLPTACYQEAALKGQLIVAVDELDKMLGFFCFLATTSSV